MRLALFPDEYLPGSTRVHAKMLHELALELLIRGHEPIIITPGDASQSERLLVDQIDGVEVWRFKSGQTRGVSKLRRALNESLFPFKAWAAIKGRVRAQPFDGVINYSPTIFFGGVVKKIKRASLCRSYLIQRDMFPQWIIDEGMIKEGSLIARYFRYFERINYNSSDHIGVMSDGNLKLFRGWFPNYKNVSVLRNWADTRSVPVIDENLSIRDELNLGDKTIFFYGGNIGHAQDMTNLLRLVRSMLPYTNCHFLFVGQGDEFELVDALSKEWNLSNLSLLPSVSQEKFKQLLKQVDVGLFSLSKLHSAHNFPGKLLGYMVESLPILGSVNLGNDLIEVINEAESGFAFVNGDDKSLFDAARSLECNQTARLTLGQNSNKLLHKYFSVNAAANHILDALTVNMGAK